MTTIAFFRHLVWHGEAAIICLQYHSLSSEDEIALGVPGAGAAVL